ncbi:thiamine diphosphokinase [Romboutsia lituseburensis]|uniref:Thiamine diphosphokinase n=1 Tax=Romboutsia lituseburensis DSM 797 TaxID=1121325 RepID=A0A1G9QBS8_9FIRM|nr:thiamine diphosphokinase [Romboutsia lituseburensis]CEH35435.1 Thiamine diphosphokinase [Romboutsia lituseburensis]SDM08380.1 thiamine diphosphokinase [Romboutsia lituseburensis DSM 797]
MKVCIVLNGEISNYNKLKNHILKENYDYIICADGGANHTYNMKIKPNFIIGDLDSVKEEVRIYYKNSDVKFEKFPAKKNETDTELCIYLAQKLNATNIDFLGALGGRIDHMIANINLLYYVKMQGIIPRIISDNEEIYIVDNEEIEIYGKKGDVISVIPINGDAKYVTLSNLEYPLENYNMKFYLPLGISNVMIENKCKIKVDEGSLLVIKNK